MRRDDFLDAFRRLGQRLTEPARLVLAGGSALQPTPEEIVWVEEQLDRLNRVAPHRALRIQLYLEQGSAPEVDGNDGK